MHILKSRDRAVVACIGMLALLPTAAQAGGDKYNITAAEKAACSSDAIRLCMDAYPDEDRLLSCMAQNRVALSRPCRVAFDSGLKRRHIATK